jgi:hypothetical protein
MRNLAFAAAAILALSGGAAFAAPAMVSVSVGPELSKKAHKSYGVKEVDRLAEELRSDVERELARTGAYQDSRIELVLTDAKPNRPTFDQMGRRPDLSMESFGIGGARIEGRAVAADGTVTPLAYRWYETDIRQAPYKWVWSDAEWAFDRFARQLSHGHKLAMR